MSRELNRNRMKLDKAQLVAQMEVLDQRNIELIKIAREKEELAIAQTKNALALALQNMTTIATEVLQEHYNFNESEAKKFENEFFKRFRSKLDNMGIDTPVKVEEANAQS